MTDKAVSYPELPKARMRTLPFAVFDEHGKPADDRVSDFGYACWEDGATAAREQDRARAAAPQAAVGLSDADVDDAMALAFHYAITDGSIGKDDLEDIKIGLRAVFVNMPATKPEAPAPEQLVSMRAAEDAQQAALLEKFGPMAAGMPRDSDQWAEPKPETLAEAWDAPTTYLQRLGDAIQALCSGHRPADEMMTAYLETECAELQEFCINYGPSWAQGVGVIDAARVLADQPTEGIEHEFRPTPAEAPANEVAWDAWQAARRAQASAEPVGVVVHSTMRGADASWSRGKPPPLGTKLYASPQQAPLTDEQIAVAATECWATSIYSNVATRETPHQMYAQAFERGAGWALGAVAREGEHG